MKKKHILSLGIAPIAGVLLSYAAIGWAQTEAQKPQADREAKIKKLEDEFLKKSREKGTLKTFAHELARLQMKLDDERELRRTLMKKAKDNLTAESKRLIKVLSGQQNKIDFHRIEHPVKIGSKTYTYDFKKPVAKADAFISGIRLYQPNNERHDFVA